MSAEEEEVAFRHHILQEFFAGRGVAEPGQLAGLVADEWWRKPIIFHFGDASASRVFQNKCTNWLLHVYNGIYHFFILLCA